MIVAWLEPKKLKALAWTFLPLSLQVMGGGELENTVVQGTTTTYNILSYPSTYHTTHTNTLTHHTNPVLGEKWRITNILALASLEPDDLLISQLTVYTTVPVILYTLH